MTTKVIVQANHGWPVKVTEMQPHPVGGFSEGWTQRVEAGTEREFHVHSGADLLIHEVQPNEDAAKAAGLDPVEG